MVGADGDATARHRPRTVLNTRSWWSFRQQRPPGRGSPIHQLQHIERDQRDYPRASNQHPDQGPNGQARATTDEDRRAARRDLWTQAAAAAGYADQSRPAGGVVGMRHTHHSTDTGEQSNDLLDRLVGDPSAVDDYYTARHHSPSIDRDPTAGTQLPRTA